MDYIFSKHAIEQMLNRSIEKDNVIETIEHPDEIIYEDDNQLIYQRIFKKEVSINAYMVRVFINATSATSLVKTVYLTTKLIKYLK